MTTVMSLSANHREGGGGFDVDVAVTFDFPASPVSSEPRVLPSEERVNLRTVSLKDGYKVMMEPRDQSRRG